MRACGNLGVKLLEFVRGNVHACRVCVRLAQAITLEIFEKVIKKRLKTKGFPRQSRILTLSLIKSSQKFYENNRNNTFGFTYIHIDYVENF